MEERILKGKALIELEYLREKHYLEIKDLLHRYLPELKIKDISNILLRYVFNKIPLRKATDDPVFVLTEGAKDPAEIQIRRDVGWYKLKINPEQIIKIIKDGFHKAKKEIDSTVVKDAAVKLECKSGLLLYKEKFIRDCNSLGKLHPELLEYVYALNIRYGYLSLDNHGLARTFEKMGFSPKDNVMECFASVFNHYFDKFCSAFPDLEKPFGSLGSFFETTKFVAPMVYVNPPFDETVIHAAIDHVLTIRNPGHYIMTLPRWENYDPLHFHPTWTDPITKELKLLEYPDITVVIKIFSKKEIEFRDPDTEKIIHPHDIFELHLYIK